MALDGKANRVPQNSGLVGSTIGIRIGDEWLRCKVESVARKRKPQAKAAESGTVAAAPKVELTKWGIRANFGAGYPFFLDGTFDLTTDDLDAASHGESWFVIVDKPEPEPAIDHSLCCYRQHNAGCVIEREIAASPDTPNTTRILPCANHPGVFLHHMCMTNAEKVLREEMGGDFSFEALPLGHFCHDCLVNCKK